MNTLVDREQCKAMRKASESIDHRPLARNRWASASRTVASPDSQQSKDYSRCQTDYAGKTK